MKKGKVARLVCPFSCLSVNEELDRQPVPLEGETKVTKRSQNVGLLPTRDVRR